MSQEKKWLAHMRTLSPFHCFLELVFFEFLLARTAAKESDQYFHTEVAAALCWV